MLYSPYSNNASQDRHAEMQGDAVSKYVNLSGQWHIQHDDSLCCVIVRIKTCVWFLSTCTQEEVCCNQTLVNS